MQYILILVNIRKIVKNTENRKGICRETSADKGCDGSNPDGGIINEK
jgi:hypothetical protein